MGWWWRGGAVAPECPRAGCSWGSALARGSAAAGAPAGGAAGGDAVALTDTEGPDVVP